MKCAINWPHNDDIQKLILENREQDFLVIFFLLKKFTPLHIIISFTPGRWLMEYKSASFWCMHSTMSMVCLKEKLPQAFMQIVWMEDDFRNLTAKVWANLDNPIKRYDFSKVSLICVCRPLRWHSSNICDVTTVQLSNGTVHKILLNFTFHKNVSSLFFYT